MANATLSVCIQETSPWTLQQLLERRALHSHFQPIVELCTASVYAHESLVRGPPDGPLAMPAALFEAARQESLVTALEFECVRMALNTWRHIEAHGRLFVNFSASALMSAFDEKRVDASLTFLESWRLAPQTLVIELTEHDRVLDVPRLHEIVELLRQRGVQFALDDFGDGRSSLRLWSELRPHYVKIDRYFTRGLAQDLNKLHLFRALLQLAQTFGGKLVAEGVESGEELRALRDLEVPYAQGWYLGRPASAPVAEPPPQALEVLRSRRIAVLPEMPATTKRPIVASLISSALAVDPNTTNEELFQLFANDAELQAIAIVEDAKPVALIDCHQFLSLYARPFFREVYGRRSCMTFAEPHPPLLDVNATIDALIAVLTTGDQRYLRQGFIIVDQGHYLGVGTGQALVKAVTEARIEAARHANPLTFLPGNVPVSQHIERMLGTGGTFVVAHADLNHFKSYNDYYGYWRGDEMIRVAAAVVSTHCDARRDFVGHIGGDDFVVAFQSHDWEDRCQRIIQQFNERALELFDPGARRAGGIASDDREGERRFYPCTTISIGVVRVPDTRYPAAEEVAAAAAAAKRTAKQRGIGLFVAR